MRDAAKESWISTRAEVVAAMRSGLLTGREVIERLGISAGMLGGWVRAEETRLSRRGASGDFAEVSLVGSGPRSASAVVLLRGGRRVRVSAGFDAAELVRLVRALESC